MDTLFQYKVKEEIQAACDIFLELYKKKWKISKKEFNDIDTKSKLLAKFANEEFKKQYCRLLYEGRVQSFLTSYHDKYKTLEYNFRVLCQPTLNSEESFCNLPSPLSAAEDEGAAIQINPAFSTV